MMQYRNLGRTGVQVSALCLGCLNFGQRTNEQDSIQIISRAIDMGINFLDTSNSYGRGGSEKVVGKALKESGQRSRMIVSTKVHYPMDDDDPNAAGNQRRHIIDQCEQSLRRLETDWIDVYHIHRPDAHIPIDETLRALDDLITSGKVRYIGCSTFPAWKVVESLWASKEFGLNRFISEQPPYNLLDRRIERELVPMAQTFGLAINPWSPLAGGLLSGKYRQGRPAPEGARFDELSEWWRPPGLFSAAAFRIAEKVQELAAKKGCSTSQFALAWIAQQPGITSPIIGPRTFDQLEDNMGALELVIDDDERRLIDEVSPPGRVVASYYESDAGVGFRPNQHRW